MRSAGAGHAENYMEGAGRLPAIALAGEWADLHA
jgi:hypothetical protein